VVGGGSSSSSSSGSGGGGGGSSSSSNGILYLSAELNSQWPITVSARIHTAAIRQTQGKRNKKKIGKLIG
jgi:hypothetical protein